MKNYCNILDNMNVKVKQLEQDVQKLENSFSSTEDISQYIAAHKEHHEVREIYHNFFAYCVWNDFDIDSECNDITLNK